LYTVFNSLKRKTEVESSVKKILVLVLLLAIFCIVALTARWAEKSGYNHINHRSEQSDESAPDNSSNRNRADNLSTYSDPWQTEPETESRFVTKWISRSDDSHDLAALKARAADRKLNRVGKNLVESANSQGSEDPDDSTYVYGDTDVE